MHSSFAGLLEQTRQQRERVRGLPEGIVCGRLRRVSGMVLEVEGLPLMMGARAQVHSAQSDQWLEAECIGFEGDITYLMGLDPLQALAPGASVVPSGTPRWQAGDYRLAPLPERLSIGTHLLGRVVDGLGRPLDGKAGGSALAAAGYAPLINPLQRAPIRKPLDTGVRAINACLTVGQGQRVGLFAGSGVGKSVLLSMLVRNCQADVIVVALVGERSREVREFCDRILQGAAQARSVVVAAPADTSALARAKAAEFASEVAGWFRDQGRHVVLIVDSLTRYAMALREIGLGLGQPPAARGYPASVFAGLPQIVEKAGNGYREDGSLTAFYTLLLEGDDVHDPVADAARGVLDGHIFLSRELADAGHYPAIDIERSISRVMPQLVDGDHLKAAGTLKAMISKHTRSRDLIAMGAYVRGTDPQLDFALKNWDRITGFLKQTPQEVCALADCNEALLQVTRGAP